MGEVGGVGGSVSIRVGECIYGCSWLDGFAVATCVIS